MLPRPVVAEEIGGEASPLLAFCVLDEIAVVSEHIENETEVGTLTGIVRGRLPKMNPLHLVSRETGRVFAQILQQCLGESRIEGIENLRELVPHVSDFRFPSGPVHPHK